MTRRSRTPMLGPRQASPVTRSGAVATGRVDFVLGFDLGFARSPTAAALLGFDRPQPRLIDTRTIRHRIAGDWQQRVSDVLMQIEEWLPGYVLLEYGRSLLIAYSLPHVRLSIQTALKLADLGGGIRGLAIGFGLPVIGVQEAESKVALTRSAQATKDDMMAAAQRLFGRDVTEHEADAVGHTLAGEANYRRELLVRKAVAR